MESLLYSLIAFVLGLVIGYLARGWRKPVAGAGPKHAKSESAPPAPTTEPGQSGQSGQDEPPTPKAVITPTPATRPAAKRDPQDPALNQLDDEHRTNILREPQAGSADQPPTEDPTAPAPPPTDQTESDAPAADPAPVDPVATDAAATDTTATDAPATDASATNAERNGSAAKAWAPGPYPASALPVADGAAPAAEFTVKAKADSKLFHTENSPYYRRVKPDVWFRSEADAVAAGFTGWVRRAKAK